MSTAMNKIRNPFNERQGSAGSYAAGGLDGGPLYGVHERDNWLLADETNNASQPSQE